MKLSNEIILNAVNEASAAGMVKAELLERTYTMSVREINEEIVLISKVAAKLRSQAYRMMDCVAIMNAEIRRRAEELEQRP